MSPSTVRVAVVRYENDLSEISRCVRSVQRAGERAISGAAPLVRSLTIAIGDCSGYPLADAALGQLQQLVSLPVRLEYRWFGENLGHSGGCNSLVSDCDDDVFLFLNPDTYAAPGLLEHLLPALSEPKVGAADARQIPCEHPKHFDPVSGEQSWASGSCLLVDADVFRKAGGFDAQFFPSYVNDVDLSWRIRLLGKTVVHRPRAVIFHDKRLNQRGTVLPTSIEGLAGALGRLMLAVRFDRPDVLEETIEHIERAGTTNQKLALASFREAADKGDLPAPLTHASSVAEFNADEYGRRRF